MTSDSRIPILFHGKSADGTPDYPHIDRMISRVLRRRGYQGRRHGPRVTYAALTARQAEEYADGEHNLFHATPKIGSVVTWLQGVHDVVLEFEEFLRQRWYQDAYRFRGVSHRFLLEDTRGCLRAVGGHLEDGRQEAAVARIIDVFLDEHDVREIIYRGPEDLCAIGNHQGEVTIYGGCSLARIGPNPHATIDPAPQVPVSQTHHRLEHDMDAYFAT